MLRGFGSNRNFPVSARLAASVLSLPIHRSLSNRDFHLIVRDDPLVVGDPA